MSPRRSTPGHQQVNQSPSPNLRRSLLAVAITLSLISSAEAATISVSGDCTLIKAINEANTATNTEADCDDGDALGTDTLILTNSSTHTLTAFNNNTNGDNGLPSITSAITINGNNSTILRSSASPFRLFHVASGARLSLNQITLSGGHGGSGGAIHNRGALHLNNSILSGNTGGDGGGIYTYMGDISLTNSTLDNNHATGQGGGLYIRFSTATLNNSTISNNTAALQGGGILNTTSSNTTTISNSTLSGNHVTSPSSGGGGIFTSGPLTLINSTLSDNNGTIDGSGLRIGSGLVTLSNSIIANGIGGDDCDLVSGTITADSQNIIEDGSCGTSATTGDPGLGPLADNGGPTLTHALLDGSSAINTGDNATCSPDPVNNRDQRGVWRPVGIQCDIGAYEFTPAPSTISVNAGCSLINAISAANTNTAIGGCPAGGGHDTIQLTGSAYNLTIPVSPDVRGKNGLPPITSTITINGNGSTIQRTGASAFRLLHVANRGNLTLDQITLSGGLATAAGDGRLGGAILSKGQLLLRNSTVSNNSASYGGGLFSRELSGQTNTITLVNSTLSGNSASYDGGGIFNTFSTLSLHNSTLSGNGAGVIGGGFYNYASVVSLANTLIANSPNGGDCGSAGGGAVNANTNNLIEDGSCGTTALTGDPKLGPLKDNGGPTQTHALAASSAAVDKGDDVACAASPVNNLDQRGIARPVGDHCDIGAYEYKDEGGFFVIPVTGGKAAIFSL